MLESAKIFNPAARVVPRQSRSREYAIAQANAEDVAELRPLPVSGVSSAEGGYVFVMGRVCVCVAKDGAQSGAAAQL
jgi:hypothetical protein